MDYYKIRQTDIGIWQHSTYKIRRGYVINIIKPMLLMVKENTNNHWCNSYANDHTHSTIIQGIEYNCI